MRILCIVQAGHEADYLEKGLRELAYRVDIAHDVDEAVFLCDEAAYDILILALEHASHAAIERLILAGAGAKLIVITAQDSSALRTAVLRAGADACLTRPWSFIELQTRLQVLERRTLGSRVSAVDAHSHSAKTDTGHARLPIEKANRQAASSLPAPAHMDPVSPARPASTKPVAPEPVQLRAPHRAVTSPGTLSDTAALRLDAASRSLVTARTAVPLSRREYLVLECLMRAAHAAVNRDQLLQYAWTADEMADVSTLNTLISRLRAKVSAAGVTMPLETVVGHGYRYLG
jgi:two-component system OmpR family response regulator